MTAPEGVEILRACALRVIAKHLEREGMRGIEIDSGPGVVDMTFDRRGTVVRARMKADTYFGVDPIKIADMSLPFYRADSGDYALQVVAHHLTRQPGWMYSDEIDELYYYLVAIDQTEEDLAFLAGEPDDVFFPSIRILRDELHVLPMDGLRSWFDEHHEEYHSRPVNVGDHSAWYRIAPRAKVAKELEGLSIVGSIYRAD